MGVWCGRTAPDLGLAGYRAAALSLALREPGVPGAPCYSPGARL